ncbi:nucleoside triphosphate pyrophosphohydrolase [Halobacillus sp. KGW1]|uniref:nucleoside triphosphate pyrophosphohydrolase n=1 Tax=Halobacillus sp. KGW1 TaxID=1793726 RepID=UPI0007838B5B|nr:nucleoside triphosphate pyrophosphohydrolase [Halobacillus sp. KGW1]
MPTYNKLVRDFIPEIIKKNGKQLNTSILTDEEYVIELKAKLEEEVKEFLEAEGKEDSVEELADVLELLYALANQLGSSAEELEHVRAQKAKDRGAFNDKVYLIDVED